MTTDLVRSALQATCAVTALLCSFATFVIAQQSSGYSDTIVLPPYYPGNPPALVLGGIEAPHSIIHASSVAYPVQSPAVQGVVPAPVQAQVFAQPLPIQPIAVAQSELQSVKPSEGAQPSRGQDTPPAQPREVKQAVVVPAQTDHNRV